MFEAESPEERQRAYERLAAAARRAGMPLERLNAALRRVAHNEQLTRRFLAEEVYGVTDEELDALIRSRLGGAGEDPEEEAS